MPSLRRLLNTDDGDITGGVSLTTVKGAVRPSRRLPSFFGGGLPREASRPPITWLLGQDQPSADRMMPSPPPTGGPDRFPT